MQIWTVGHSRHPFAKFLTLLTQHHITIIVDVRSSPFSRWRHFNRDKLSHALSEQDIDYRYCGSLLGGRNEISVVAEPFGEAMEDVLQLIANRQRVALMCSEGRFCECHRAGKLTAWLHRNRPNVQTTHILPDGSSVDARDNEHRVLDSVWWSEFSR